MEIFNFKCKYCGGEMGQVDGLKSVGKCKYCGSKQTLPKLHDEKRANLFERANHLRRNNEFDKAEALYEQILNDDLSDPEAYWSLVLCRYGIEYVEDVRTKERIPTVNRMQMTSILGDEDYKSAIENADDEQKQLYEAEAKIINEIQKGILEISRKEEPFDVFICYKETDADGKRSRDSVLAQDLYHELTRDGYKVFFARVTLQGKLGSAYEPYIFSALNSSKVMVVLGTKKEHFEAVWVRNEWSRFLGQIKKGERKTLIPAYRDMDAYDLPPEFSNLQALDMSRLGFMQELIQAINSILAMYKSSSKQKKAEPAFEPEPAPAAKATKTKKTKGEKPKKKKGGAIVLSLIALLLVGAIGAGVLAATGIIKLPFEIPFLNELLNIGGGTESEIPIETETEPQNTSDSKLAFMKLGTGYHVTGIGNETGKDITIPAYYNGLPVTAIDYGAFANTDITSVTIPDSVTSIGTSAFENCASLQTVSMPASVTKIGANAFKNCTALTAIDFYGTQAEWNAINFESGWDSGLSSYTVDCTDTDIVVGGGEETTTGGEGTDIIEPPTPSSTFEIGVEYHAYINQEDLDKTIYLTNHFNTQYTYLLNGTESLEDAGSIYFENASDGKYYMYFLEDSVKQYINIELIENNGNNYWNVKLRESASSAWYWSEEYKTLLTDDLNGAMFIGTQKGKGYTDMQSMRIDQDGAASYMLNFAKAEDFDMPTGSTSGLTYEKSSDGAYYIVTGVSASATDVRIPETYDGLPVKEIKTQAFERHEKIRSIYIPKSITKIGSNAFYCSTLTTVRFASGSQLEDVGYQAFRETKLTQVTLPEGTKTVGEYAFAFAPITSASLPSTVEKIDKHAFWECSSLKEVTVLSSDVEICEAAFTRCNALETITVTGNVTSPVIAEALFSSSVKNANVHTSVLTYINATKLENLVITGGDTVPNSALTNAVNLKTVVVSSSVRKIESGAFSGLANIESFEYQGTEAEWDSVEKDDNWYSGFDPSIVVCTGTSSGGTNTNPGGNTSTDYNDPDNVGGNIQSGVAYNAVFYHGNLNSKYYLTGSMTGGHNQYLAASTGSANAATVYIEEIDLGDFYIYFNVNGTKLYLNIIESTTDGTLYYNPALEEDAITPWCWDVNNDCLVGNYNGNGYFLGTVKTSSYDNIALVPDDGSKKPDDYFTLYFVPAQGGSNVEINGTVGDLTMHLKDGVLTISGEGEMIELENYPWAGEGVTEIFIENGVTSVAPGAFKNMTSLRTVSFPATLKTIGSGAFNGCSSLTDAYFNENSALLYNGKTVDLSEPQKNAEFLKKTYVLLDWSLTFVDPNAVTNIEYGVPYYGVIYQGNLGEKYYLTGYLVTTDMGTYFDTTDNISEAAPMYFEKPRTNSGYNPAVYFMVNGEKKYLALETNGSNPHYPALWGSGGQTWEWNTTEKYFTATMNGTIFIGISSSSLDSLAAALDIAEVDTAFKMYFIPGEAGEEGGDTTVTETVTIGGVVYTFNTDTQTYSVTGFNSPSSSITISSSVNGYPVTKIAERAFYSCEKIIHVQIEDGIERIEEYAFWGCHKLETIEIPDSVQFIGREMFADCFRLTSVTFPDGVPSIGDSAFYNCESLTTLIVPTSVTSIGSNAMWGCSSLESITYKGTEQQWNAINKNATWADNFDESKVTFSGGSNNENNSCDVNGHTAQGWSYTADGGHWQNCTICGQTINSGAHSFVDGSCDVCGYKSENVDDGTIEQDGIVYTLDAENGGYVITGYTDAITYTPSIAFELNIVGIADGAFQNCTALRTLELTNCTSLTSIGNDAFAGCTTLRNVNFPTTLTSIGERAFQNTSISWLRLPEGVISIGANAFESTQITTLTIPASVTTIGANAFAGCSSLTKVTFEGAPLNATVSTADGVASSLTITNDDVQINATWLTDLYLFSAWTLTPGSSDNPDDPGTGDTPASNITVDNMVYTLNLDGTTYTLSSGAWASGDIVIPAQINGLNVTGIAVMAFEGNTAITSLTFADGSNINYIGHGCFRDCTNLETVNMSSITGVTFLPNELFFRCSNLKNVTIPNSITSISSRVFGMDYGTTVIPNLVYTVENGACYLGSQENPHLILMKAENTSITSCIINSSTKLVYEDAFADCNSLTYNEYGGMHYLGTAENQYFMLVKLTSKTQSTYYIQETTKIVYNDVFRGCSYLTNITIPENVVSIGQYAFFGCSQLKKIILSSNIEHLGMEMFTNCSSLTSITIPAKVKQIGHSMFYGSGLQSITFEGNVVSFGCNLFSGCNISSITLPASVRDIDSNAFGNVSSITFKGTEAEWDAIWRAQDWGNCTVTFAN